jgi:tetratricopeptide (TPR) repeat protein
MAGESDVVSPGAAGSRRSVAKSADELLHDWASPDALELATSLSLAATVDSALVRRTRLRLHPGMSAAAEAELWFSRGIAVSGVRSIVIDGELLPALRRRLKRRPPEDPASLPNVFEMLVELRAAENASPFLVIEEEINELALGGWGRERIENYFAQALAVLRDDESLSRQVAIWAAEALPRLPAEAFSGGLGLLLAQMSSTRLKGTPIMVLTPRIDQRGVTIGIESPGIDAVQALTHLMPADHDRIDVGVRLSGWYLELSEPPCEDAHRMTAPLADPILVEIRRGGTPEDTQPPRNGKTLVLKRHSTTRFPLLGTAWLRTAGADWHLIEPVDRLPLAEQVRLAVDALNSEDLGAAEAYATEVLDAGGGDSRVIAEARRVLARVAAERGDAELAEFHYRAAVELFAAVGNNPALGQTRGELGGLLLQQGSHAAAVDELQAATSIVPGDLSLKLELARALLSIPDHLAANAVLGHILTIAPAAVEALILRGVDSAQFGDPQSALHDLDDAARIRPKVAESAEVVRARATAEARLDRRDS